MADFVSFQNQHLQLGHPQSLEQRLALAFATTGESLWKADLVEGTVSQSTIDLSVFSDGVTETVCPWTEWLERIHPADRARVLGLWSALEDGSWTADDWRLEFRLATPQGEFRDVRVQTLVARDATGRSLRAVGTLRDITADKQAQRDLEAQIRLIVESAPNAMLMADREQRIRLVNSQTEKLFGYAREELLGQPIEMLLPPRFRDGHPALVAQFFSAPQLRAMGAGRDLFGLRKDGREVPIEIGLNPMTTAEEMFVLAVIVDISERKRAERLQNRRQELLEQLAKGETLSKVLESVVTFVEQESEDAICSVLLLDESGRRLLNGAAPRLPAFYNEAIHNLEIGPTIGSCGTAAFTGKRFIAEDIETHPHWAPFLELTRKAGLRSCWSEPILSIEQQVLGTFAIYHSVPRAPKPAELEVIAIAASLCSIAIERHRIEQQMRWASDRLTLATRSAKVGVWEWDIVHNKLDWDETMFQLYGVSPNQFGGAYSAWESGLHPDDLLLEREKIQAALRGEKEFDTEFRVVWRDGSIHDIKANGLVQRDASGQPMRMLGVNWDITDRKRSEQRLRTVIEATPNGMVMLDTAGRICLVNRAAELMFGCSRDKLLGQPIEVLVPRTLRSSDVLQRQLLFEYLAAHAAQPAREFVALRHNQTEFPIELSLNPVELPEGPALLCAMVDVSERKKSLEALRESEERFRELAENVADVFWLTSPSGFHILYVSPAYRTVWGRDPESAVLNPLEWFDSICAEDQPAVERHLARMETEGTLDVEYRIVRSDGAIRWIHDSGFPIRDQAGTLQRIARIATDITERKTIEQALHSSNEELEAFCYSVSHDLRAPLRHIDGFSKAVLEDYVDKLDASGQQMLGMICEATQKMSALIDDILTLSRVSRRDMQVEEIHLGDLAREVVDELRVNRPSSNARYLIEVENTVSGDRRLLRLALLNLLDNATKFSVINPEPIIEFRSRPTKSGAEFSVKDNGAGFNMQFKAKLFVPFQRLHREEEFAGTGIGLAIVKRVIQRHSGQVWAESELGKGATFYFTVGQRSSNSSTELLPSSAAAVDFAPIESRLSQ